MKFYPHSIASFNRVIRDAASESLFMQTHIYIAGGLLYSLKKKDACTFPVVTLRAATTVVGVIWFASSCCHIFYIIGPQCSASGRDSRFSEGLVLACRPAYPWVSDHPRPSLAFSSGRNCVSLLVSYRSFGPISLPPLPNHTNTKTEYTHTHTPIDTYMLLATGDRSQICWEVLGNA